MGLGALDTEGGWNSPGVGEIGLGAGRDEKPLKPELGLCNLEGSPGGGVGRSWGRSQSRVG